jgi:hypothetical protein
MIPINSPHLTSNRARVRILNSHARWTRDEASLVLVHKPSTQITCTVVLQAISHMYVHRHIDAGLTDVVVGSKLVDACGQPRWSRSYSSFIQKTKKMEPFRSKTEFYHDCLCGFDNDDCFATGEPCFLKKKYI